MPGVGVEPISTLKTRNLLKQEAGRNHKTLKSAQMRYTVGTGKETVQQCESPSAIGYSERHPQRVHV